MFDEINVIIINIKVIDLFLEKIMKKRLLYEK